MQKQQGAPVCSGFQFFAVSFVFLFLLVLLFLFLFFRWWVLFVHAEWTGLETMKMSEHENANCHWEWSKRVRARLRVRLGRRLHLAWAAFSFRRHFTTNRLQHTVLEYPIWVCCFIRISLIKQHEILHTWRYYMGGFYEHELWIWKMADSLWLHA